MSDEIKSQLIWATVLVAIVISIPWSISYYYTTTAKAAMEHGYEQGVLPGKQSVYWICLLYTSDAADDAPRV